MVDFESFFDEFRDLRKSRGSHSQKRRSPPSESSRRDARPGHSQSHHSRRQQRNQAPQHDSGSETLRDHSDAPRRQPRTRSPTGYRGDDDRAYSRDRRESDRRHSRRKEAYEAERRESRRRTEEDWDARESERHRDDERDYGGPTDGIPRQGETLQEMDDRVDGYPKRRSNHSAIPHRPRQFTSTSYYYGGNSVRGPTPPQEPSNTKPLPRSATWPSKRSQTLSNSPQGEYSYLDHSDGRDPNDLTSHKGMNRDRAPTPPVLQDGHIIEPLMRRHTGSAALDGYEIERAGQRWEKEQQTLVPGSRIIRLPDPGPVSMMDEDDWNSKKVDRRLARKIAFADVGLTAQEKSNMTHKQEDDITRSYFASIEDLDVRLGASHAQSLAQILEITDGMKEGYLRVLKYGASKLDSKGDSGTFRPHANPLYRAFATGLDRTFEDTKKEWRQRPEVNQSEASGMRAQQNDMGTKELENSEAWAVEVLRERYGWSGTESRASRVSQADM